MDRYQIVASLGAGAAGEALVVTEKSTGAEYVLKRIHTIGMNKDERERVSREAKTLQMLNHPNIVRFKESFFDRDVKTKEDYFCIVMERCVCSLEDLINQCHEVPEGNGGFLQALLVEWMTELLAALSFLQQKGIIHRDIKSSNVFVTKKNHLKIGDFGVAKHEKENNTNNSSSDETTSNGGVGGGRPSSSSTSSHVVGSAFYMPPEVCDGAPTDHKGDVWSLGILFYELCALHPPFRGGNILAIVNEITTKSPEPLPANFDARFSKITRWMLKKDPSHRPTAQDVLNKYVFLPPSHPSHPQHDPDKGRLIQEKHGPQLVLNAGGQKTNSVAVSSSKSKTASTARSNDKDQSSSAADPVVVSSANVSPSGRIDGNKSKSSVNQKQPPQPPTAPSAGNNNNHLPRPSAVVLDDDDDDDDVRDEENQQHEPASTTSSAPPDALLLGDEQQLQQQQARGDTKTSSSLSSTISSSSSSSLSSSACDGSNSNNNNNNNNNNNKSNNNNAPRTQLGLAEDTTSNAQQLNRSKSPEGEQPTAVLMSSTDSSKQQQNVVFHHSGSTKPGASSLKEKVLDLLDSEASTLTSADLDDVVCAIAQFRVKMKLTKT